MREMEIRHNYQVKTPRSISTKLGSATVKDRESETPAF